MNRRYSIVSAAYLGTVLRAIEDRDQDHLREWKNQNRRWFFHRGIIAPSAQVEWFRNYWAREYDLMFIIEAEVCDIGCMGIRLDGDQWDIYNVILGVPDFAKKGFMGQALRMMCSHAINLTPKLVTAKVLKDNPAVNWYLRNGFRIMETNEDYVEIELDRVQFEPCSIAVIAADNDNGSNGIA
jgi:RimJ/RimL family protein N-acetyltransferase